MNGMMYPFASSISEAKNQPTTEGKLRAGIIVWILNAINPNELSAYQFKLGNQAENLPTIFQPNDNLSNYYYELVQ